jgi:methylsterol monooxygenase
MWRSIGFTAVSIYVVGGLSLLAEVNIDFQTVMDPNKRAGIQWILLQFFLMMLMEDFVFFSTHYIAHISFLYKFHKIHHEYTTSVSIAGMHFHSFEFLLTQSFSNLACLKFALLVGPVNISTFVIWLIFRVWDAYNGHSGYVFSWSPLQLLPFTTNDEFHDFHHTQNCGNYGSHFRFWDSVFGTNDQFR